MYIQKYFTSCKPRNASGQNIGNKLVCSEGYFQKETNTNWSHWLLQCRAIRDRWVLCWLDMDGASPGYRLQNWVIGPWDCSILCLLEWEQRQFFLNVNSVCSVGTAKNQVGCKVKCLQDRIQCRSRRQQRSWQGFLSFKWKCSEFVTFFLLYNNVEAFIVKIHYRPVNKTKLS